MRFAWLAWPASLVLVAVTATMVFADGFKFPNLNPFAKPKRSTFRLTGEQPQPEEPSTWSKMTSATSDFFGKTVDFVTPSFMKKKKTVMPRPSGTRRVIRATPPAKKRSFFSYFWPAKEEPRASKDINSFLIQERPDF